MSNAALTRANLKEHHARAHSGGYRHSLQTDHGFIRRWETKQELATNPDMHKAARHIIADLEHQIELIKTYLKED